MMDQRAIEELCLRYLDENLTEQEARVLDRLIATSDAAARTLARLAIHDQHFEVATPLRSANNDQDSGQALDEILYLEQHGQVNFVAWRQEQANKAAAERRKTWLIRSLISGAVAAALLVVVSLITTVFTSGSPEAPVAGQQANEQHTTAPPDHPPVDSAQAAVATLTASQNATWAEGALAPGSELSPNQRLTLTAGFAEITTARGAIALLEAPATVELLETNNAIRLHTGKLVGICETDSSKGFVVKTKHADITDLGTEFGVQADEDRVEVSVFSGEVQIQSPGLKPRLLKAKQSAEITAETDRRELVVGELASEDWNRFTRRLPRAAALAEVELLGLEGFKANVLPQGFWDGAKPYSHRWSSLNGIDGSDIPAALRGGDLVQMPGDIRSSVTPAGVNLRVQLKPMQRVDVYLLLSERQTPTDWLLRDYEQTPWEVGVALAVNRVDSYSIWKRKLPVADTTIVGQDVDKSMYLLLLVPHEPTEAHQP